jgi:hypothetical protein
MDAVPATGPRLCLTRVAWANPHENKRNLPISRHISKLRLIGSVGAKNWSADDMFKTMIRFRHKAATFAKAEGGAVTVDWVVLTAAMVVMVTGVFITINEAVMTNAAGGIADNIEEAAVR